jgi:hypothetical protein
MDTATSVLGFRLPHPLIARASPLGFDLNTIKCLEDCGAAAVVLPSPLERQTAITGRIHRETSKNPRRRESFPTLRALEPSP